jgi:hypothetical protein
MCGTSISQIERTYYHLNDNIRLTNAVADYRLDADGTICVALTVVNRIDTILQSLRQFDGCRRYHLSTESVPATYLILDDGYGIGSVSSRLGENGAAVEVMLC